MRLREYQIESTDAAWSDMRTLAGNSVIVLPTGSGKSLVIAELCREAIERWHGRVLILQHRKELIEQNAVKVRSFMPQLDIGIYSAGLKSRDTNHDVVLAGIQSAHKRADEFGQRNLVLIDEVHLVPDTGEGMYEKFLGDLRTCNPSLRMVGLTATPYRTGEGSLCGPSKLFQRICYEAKIPALIEQGYLSPIVNRPADATVDTSGLHVRGGEFIAGEMETLFGDAAKIDAACREILAKTCDRKSVLIFCAGILHAANVAKRIEQLSGERCGLVTGNSLPLERGTTLEAFRSRRLRLLCNVDVLTTGFDAPCIDAIAILRATCSPGLFAQICGRGFRLFDGKENCLILDFGQNIERHGPLDAIDFGQNKKTIAADGDAPKKECPNCGNEVHLSAVECECGFLFPARELKHDEHADEASEIICKPMEWRVVEVSLSRHIKKKDPIAPHTLRVDYLCQPLAGPIGNLTTKTISEWVCLEHEGFAATKARSWWRERCSEPVIDIDQALDLWGRGAVARPTEIVTVRDGRWLRVVKYKLTSIPAEWDEVAAEPLAAWEEFN